MSEPPAAAEEPLFCPFCRDPYEATDVCPTHGLKLVRFMELPPSREPEPPWPDHQALPRWSPRFARAPVFLGAALLLASFWLPWLHLYQPREGDLSGIALARQALNLWSVPLAATTLLVILATRRSPTKMRGARLAAVLIALMPLANLGLTFFKIFRAAGELDTRVELGWGPAVTVAGVVIAAAGALRLGVRSKRDLAELHDAAHDPGHAGGEPPTVH